MTIQRSNDIPANSVQELDATQTVDSNSPTVNRATKKRIKIRIPKDFHEEPIISRLVSHHGVTVNIAGALLGANARDDGWFDLELRGTTREIQSALTYLDELDLEIWGQSNLEEDGW